jgi:phage gpG-like protein
MVEWRFPTHVPGVTLVIVSDIDEAVRKLTQTEERLKDLTPLLKNIAKIMREGFGEQFAQGGDPSWKELAPSTILAKTAQGLPAKTAKGNIQRRLKQNGAVGPAGKLIASGALRDSYRQLGARGHVEKIDASAGTVEVGSQLKTESGANLAAIHQYGTGPYTIRARVAKSLAFTGRDGVIVFRGVVHHPGLPARPLRVTEAMNAKIAEATMEYIAGSEGVTPSAS